MDNETNFTERTNVSGTEDLKNKKLYIIGLVTLAVLAGAAVWWVTNGDGVDQTEEVVVVEGDPADSLLDFYSPLRRALIEAQSDPFVYDEDNSGQLSPAMIERVNSLYAEGRVATLNSIFCQPSVPERLRTKRVYELDDEVQFMITARDEGLNGQALATLSPVDGLWKITDVTCGGETAPEKEFSFQESGYLIKNVPPPLDSQHWHIVFSQGGVLGHTVPLFFDQNSLCVLDDGTENICNPTQFAETSKIMAAGEMSEAGLTVQRLELLK